MPNGGLFQPKAPDLLGLASGIEQIRAGRERRGLQRQALGLQQQQFQLKQQQEREQAIVQQRQKQFDQAATLLKNAPTPEIAVRSARIMGNTLGIPIDEEKLVQNLKSVQQGIGNILKLSAAGQKEDALALSIAILDQFRGTKGAEAIPGLQTGLMKDIAGIRERERRGRLLGVEEPVGVIEEEGVPITEPEGFISRPTFTGEQVLKQFGPAGLTAFEEEGVSGLSKLGKLKAPVIRDVNIGGGKVQTQGIDSSTGEKLFTVSVPFPRFKPTDGKPFEKDVEIWARIKEGDPPQLQFKKVKTVDGEVGAATLKKLEKGGYQPESIAKTNLSAQLRIPADDFSSIINRLTGRTEETQQQVAPQPPQGALTFDQFFEREKKRDPNLTRVDALEEYVRQIEAAR
jgi:hypothetical protein